jgi:hypothetical protein
MEGFAFFRGLRIFSEYIPEKMGVVASLSHLMLQSVKDTNILMVSSRLDVLPLRILLDMFHNNNATDRRDKIYALVGMSSEASLSINIDYTKS